MARWIALVGLLVLLSHATGAPADEASKPTDGISALLAHAGSAPDFRMHPLFKGRDPSAPPPEDTPLDALALYWSTVGGRYGEDFFAERTGIIIGDRVRLRLLVACEKKPALLANLITFFPDSSDFVPRVEAAYRTAMRADPPPDEEWQDTVKSWLMYRSLVFRDELIAEAKQVRFERGYITGDHALTALARLDWPAAEPILDKLAEDGNPRLAAYALATQYAHLAQRKDGPPREPANDAAIQLRKKLQRIAEDTPGTTPASARARAIEALMSVQWPGRDAWFTQQLRDPSLRDCEERSTLYRPLHQVVRDDPDRWIPVLTRMIGDKVPAVHDNAVSCLVDFHLENARRDALEPLIPWLGDPKWSRLQGIERLRFVQSLTRVDLPVPTPVLIKLLEEDRGFQMEAAATALGKRRAKEAGPALRKAYEEGRDIHRRTVLDAMIACDAVADAEVLPAIEAYARRKADIDARAKGDFSIEYDLMSREPLTAAEAYGRALGHRLDKNAALAEKLLARARELKEKEPRVAEALRDIVSYWPVKPADADVLARATEPGAGVKVLWRALARGQSIRANLEKELRARLQGGEVAGIVAAILEDEKVTAALLAGDDRKAQRALIACARSARIPLPMREVAALLDIKEAGLAVAAERYLETIDTPETWAILAARYPDELCVFGQTTGISPGHFRQQNQDHDVKKLIAELRGKDAPDDIYALFSGGGWGGVGDFIIRGKGGKAELDVRRETGRRFVRTLADAEWNELAAFLRESQFDRLYAMDTGHVMDGVWYDYVHLTPKLGRRIHMNNPGTALPGSPYHVVAHKFHELADRPGLRAEYEASKLIPGFEVVHPAADGRAYSLWMTAQGVAVQVREKDRTVWRTIVAEPGKAARLADPIERPKDARIGNDQSDIPSFESGSEFLNPEHLQSPREFCRLGERFVRVSARGGLHLCQKGSKPVVFIDSRDYFAKPMVSPDGKWIVAAMATNGWAQPNDVVRVEVATKKIIPIGVTAADTFLPIAYVPAHGQVLLERSADRAGGAGPEKTEYILLDPATGKSEVVTGEFDPLEHAATLQPTANPDEFWVALMSKEEKDEYWSTHVGRYDAKAFKFTSVVAAPSLEFWSGDICVDEKGGWVYAIVLGDVVRFPLKK